MEKTMLPAAILLSCAIAASSFSILTRHSARKNIALQETRLEYDVGLICLQLPSGWGGHSVLQKINHDDIIAKAVSEVKEKLYVYISSTSENLSSPTKKKNDDFDSSAHTFHATTSDMTSYISEIYNRIWDEMCLLGKYDLDCTVTGDFPESDNNFKEELEKLSNLNVVYTDSKKSSNIEQLNELRVSQGNAKVEHRLFSLSESSLDHDVHYFFVDAADADIPLYKKIAVGGTFDRLHNGHRKLLTFAALTCVEQLTVGVSDDALLANKKNKSDIENIVERISRVGEFLRGIKKDKDLSLNIVPINDPFGPTITDHTIDAIIVSSETLMGAKKINQIRREKNMKPLDVLITRRSMGATLSSTFLRNVQR